MVPLVRQSGAPPAVSYFTGYSAVVVLPGDVLRPSEFAVLPKRLYPDLQYSISKTDGHWSPKGHELVAQLLFSLIQDRGLLPQLALTPWPEVEGPALAELKQTWADESRRKEEHFWEPPEEALSSLEPAHFTDLEWRHVYTGLDDKGQVSPFASFFLARKGQEQLLVRGHALAKPELAGERLKVSIEGNPVGEHELVPGEPFELSFPLPAGLAPRCGIDVRLESSDYVYAGKDRQHCISFVLDELALR